MSETDILSPDTPDLTLHQQALNIVWREAYQSDDLVTILDALYDHEINHGLQSFWDDGWHAWLGDEMMGKRVDKHFARYEIRAIAPWLKRAAEDHYPVLKRGRLDTRSVT